MATPILICDDSSFARKQMARALPSDWDVEITFAENGQIGLEAIKAGKGEVVFLDLTMPVLDGFSVLKIMQSEAMGINTIVISADIQSEAKKMVEAAGALDFIRKPISEDALIQVLNKHNLL